MAENSLPYIPASRGFYQPPLGRYLPTLPKDVMRTWITENTQPGALLLDPLGAHPMLPIEAANAGARMLVARNNPILWLLLETAASAPSSEQLEKVLSKLLITRRGGKTIENHLRTIYITPCSGCGQMVQAAGFIWEKDNSLPVSRVYSCPQCGDEGEKEISDFDIKNLDDLGSLGLHRARAFQRVLLGGEYEQKSIESALNCYLPRALYVCMTLVNRLDRMELSKAERRMLQAMMLLVFDDATALWHWPNRDQHYFQLSIPSRYFEKNLWLSLESAPNRLEQSTKVVPVTYWPNLPDQTGGICLYQRRLAEKQDLFKNEHPQGIATMFPRPNQAFWTLSALWSGWLWGREAVSPMRSALARRHYDWRWFAQALEAAFKDLPQAVQKGTKLFGLLSQAAPNHFMGLLTGINASDFNLGGYAISESDEIIQCVWHSNGEINPLEQIPLRSTIRSFLENRGEPCGFQQIINDYLAKNAMLGYLPANISTMEETYFSNLQQKVSDVLRNENFVKSIQSSPASSSQWWLVDNQHARCPLSDRMEKVLLEILFETPKIALATLEQKICQRLTGRETPERDAIRVCLGTYADQDESGNFILREGESQNARQKDIEEMAALLESCGKGFGLDIVRLETSVKWLDKKNQCLYIFHILTTSNISPILLNAGPVEAQKQVLVFPGSHSRWLIYRLRQDPRLEKILNDNWHLLKFRYLRWLATHGETNLETWEKLLKSDPPQWEASPQIQLL